MKQILDLYLNSNGIYKINVNRKLKDKIQCSAVLHPSTEEQNKIKHRKLV